MNTTVDRADDPFATPLFTESEAFEQDVNRAYFGTCDVLNALRTQMCRTPDDQRLRVAYTAAREAHTALIRLKDALTEGH